MADAPDSTPAAPEPVADSVPGGLEDAPNLTADEVFTFDPFAEGGVPNQPPNPDDVTDTGTAPEPGEGEPPAPEPVQEPAPEAPVATEEAAPAAPATAQPTYEQIYEQNRVLAEQNRQILELIARNQPPPTVPAVPEPKKTPEYPNYMFEIPQEIQNLLQSDTPGDSQRGLAALIAAMGRTVHTHVREEYEQRLHAAINEARQTFATDTQRAATAQQVFNDFYGTYPQFNRPELRDLVASATKAVVDETKSTQWSTGLRDQIGERVSQIIQSVSGTPQAQAAPAPARKPAPAAAPSRAPSAPPKMRGTSVRPAPEGKPEPGTQEAHMYEVIHGVN